MKWITRAFEVGPSHRLKELWGSDKLLKHTVALFLAYEILLMSFHVAALNELDDSIGLSQLVDKACPGSKHEGRSESTSRHEHYSGVECRDVEACQE